MADAREKLPSNADLDRARPFAEWHATGLLWFINRVALHPRGFALAFHYPDDAEKAAVLRGEIEPIGWSILGDGEEVWGFDEESDDECFALLNQLLAEATESNHEFEQSKRIAKARQESMTMSALSHPSSR